MRAAAVLLATLSVASCGGPSPVTDARTETPDAIASDATMVDAPTQDVASMEDGVGAADAADGADATSADTQENPWRLEPRLPAAWQEIGATAHNGELWVAGGFEGFRIVDSVRAFDPRTGLWRDGPRLPTVRHHVSLVSAGDDLYSLGGELGTNFTPDAECYVLRRGETAWRAIAPMPEARGAMVAGFINGAIYVAGGVGPRSTLVAAVYRYDPVANRWSIGASIPTVREHLAGFVYGGRLFALGGRRLTLDSVTNVVEAYDPSMDRWETLAPMPTARGGFAASVWGDTAIANGGELEAEALVTADALDLRTLSWRRAPSTRVPHHGHGSVGLDGRIYVIGGGVRPILAATAIVESLAVP